MERIMVNELENHINKKVEIKGWVYRVRKLKTITFIILRDRTGLVQCVVENSCMDISGVKLESVVSIIGEVKESNNALNSFEILIEKFQVINASIGELPIEINNDELEINLDTMLNNRVLSLRHAKVNSIFKIQNIIVRGFRQLLINEGFTEIFTPKIVAEGTEGGTDMFQVKYFENIAYLAQSPQFYKQMMVGAGFERVFEVAHVYRAEQHNTTRHLNEYISMDLEMGFIKDEEDIMQMEERLLKFILNKVEEEGKIYLETLNADMPKIEDKIPKIKFSEALKILEKEYNKTDLDGDLDPEGEKLICRYAKEKLGCDFIFLTHYPTRKRPMYTMPYGEEETRSFDLLFRGVEITTGGQRIHDYNMLIKNIEYKGLVPENYENYTSLFKHGMPIHGGLAIGLERITAQLLSLENVREASLFPRDRTRLVP
ncbi:aspartate--tRNA(Asn) ligase [Clostridium tagluense]|uniref:aspartate--tRNA(Asn) ligase n=1 Tax=Clostridium tagluense TaxID=360422 RepID=UPI001CF5F0B4|nr:aspartate--tRNA(Asn) ligase [Clostridium tagluense]MCB2312593.1 aspartate--tRNA(Asn) ligase [Clostridium tagluense]MCB2317269.1 aspartate--tRNA(Asn) ligase [Clostridium tagluense]MCB2322136.1 aspartate--tRNA(Asn) ligase [Clostridium tagluense]MCB2327065.1 aspartate--tRNA(Asn) ligase [Clostridium tagluense]MCB2331783.1 aspartate--tRNA(Asn) ligase [Clostridium tagluense]